MLSTLDIHRGSGRVNSKLLHFLDIRHTSQATYRSMHQSISNLEKQRGDILCGTRMNTCRIDGL